jgi:hypothetical protein
VGNSPRIPVSVVEAKEQAAEYFGFTASKFIQVDGGKVFEIPNPGLMNDDQQERWDELQFALEKCDREPDIEIPERTVTDADGTTTVIPAQTIPGQVSLPHRVNGELLKPPYNVRLAIALFGEDGYAEYKAGGGIANQIALEWARMNREYQERVEEDPKSGGGSPTLAVVPSGD